jgi:hypothetical protein
LRSHIHSHPRTTPAAVALALSALLVIAAAVEARRIWREILEVVP